MEVKGFDCEEQTITLVLENEKIYPINMDIVRKIPVLSNMVDLDSTILNENTLVELIQINENTIRFIVGYYDMYGKKTDEYYISMPLYRYDLPTEYLTYQDAEYFGCLKTDNIEEYIEGIRGIVRQVNYLGCDTLTHKLCALVAGLSKLK
jgi:hypothetical protein